MRGWNIPNEIAINKTSDLVNTDLSRVSKVSHRARDVAVRLLYAHPKVVGNDSALSIIEIHLLL